MARPCPFSEDNFTRLASQSNVYGLAAFRTPAAGPEALVAALKGKLLSLRYERVGTPGRLRAVAREVHFTYIPVDAEIVSIDAFCKPAPRSGLVIGITFIKDSGDKASPFLNIYCDYEPGSEYNLDSIAQSCLNLELQFIPFQLCHTEVQDGPTSETVFLLSGHDMCVHVYKESGTQHQFEEVAVETFFPELTQLSGNVQWLQVLALPCGKRRLTAVGSQNGAVSLALVQLSSRTVLQRWSVQQDGPVSHVQIFPTDPHGEAADELPSFHLLVASAIETSVVYRDVLVRGLSDQAVLPGSDRYDSVLCALVCDVDCDGQDEILLGTYGQELLCFKESGGGGGKAGVSGAGGREWNLAWRRWFPGPLLALALVDVTRDGLRDLLAVTIKGLHVLQFDLEKAADILLSRLQALGSAEEAAKIGGRGPRDEGGCGDAAAETSP
ncbi:KICSTOR complex protein kaptin isoform X2 [Petromyzon marinus]|nr:KICSTOR complex protein kaptin isoform X2 [Petromyzon marinus]